MHCDYCDLLVQEIDENHPGKCIIHRKDILLLDPIGVGEFIHCYNVCQDQVIHPEA